MGLGDARRRAGARAADAVWQRGRAPRPQPPRAPLQDRAHRAPLGEVADLSPAGAGLDAQARADQVGPGPALPRPRLPGSGGGSRAGGLPDHRAAGDQGLIVSPQPRRLLLAPVAAALAASGLWALAQPRERVLRIAARMSVYLPQEDPLTRDG